MVGWWWLGDFSVSAVLGHFGFFCLRLCGTNAENATAGHVGGLRVTFGLPVGCTGGYGLIGI